MKHPIRMGTLATLFVLGPAGVGPVVAEQSHGDYVVSWDAVASTLLPAEAAWRMGVERAARRGVLTVKVAERNDTGSARGVDASLSVVARDPEGRERSVPMRRILDEGEVFYVGEFGVQDRELLNFDIQAQPTQQTELLKVAFSHRFFSPDIPMVPLD